MTRKSGNVSSMVHVDVVSVRAMMRARWDAPTKLGIRMGAVPRYDNFVSAHVLMRILFVLYSAGCTVHVGLRYIQQS